MEEKEYRLMLTEGDMAFFLAEYEHARALETQKELMERVWRDTYKEWLHKAEDDPEGVREDYYNMTGRNYNEV